MKTVQVQFNRAGQTGSGLYAYLTDIEDMKVGDTVAVDSPNFGLTLATVKSVEETAEAISKATKWIVDRVNVEAHNARLAREEERAAKSKADKFEAHLKGHKALARARGEA